MKRTQMPGVPDYNKNVTKRAPRPTGGKIPPKVERKTINVEDAQTGLPGWVRGPASKQNMGGEPSQNR